MTEQELRDILSYEVSTDNMERVIIITNQHAKDMAVGFHSWAMTEDGMMAWEHAEDSNHHYDLYIEHIKSLNQTKP